MTFAEILPPKSNVIVLAVDASDVTATIGRESSYGNNVVMVFVPVLVYWSLEAIEKEAVGVNLIRG